MRTRAPYGKSMREFVRLQAQETDDCVLWPYAADKHGYGRIKVGSHTTLVTRLSCAMAHGQPPTPKHQAAHSCHTPACFNPRHLRWATPAENAADKVNDGTSRRGVPKWNSKVTADDVRLIRYQVAKGTPQSVFAKHFGLSSGAVSNIVSGKDWSWL